MGKLVIILVKIALSGALVWYAFSKVDLSSAWETLTSIARWSLWTVLLLFVVQFAIAAVRLRELLVALGTPYAFRPAVDAVLIGVFFGQTLISFIGGDAMRVWRIVRTHVPFATAAKSVLFDRIAGFAGLLAVLLIATPFAASVIDSPEMIAGLLLMLTGAFGGIFSLALVRRLPRRAQNWRPIRIAKDVIDAGLRIWRTKRGAVAILGLSVLIHLLNVAILHVLAIGLGMQVRFLDGLVLFPIVLFLSLLPISVSGWGVREGAMVAALSVVGVPAHQSLALSVLYGLSLIVVGLPGGAIWLHSRSVPVRQVSRFSYPVADTEHSKDPR